MAKLSKHKKIFGVDCEEEFNPVKKDYEGFEEAILKEKERKRITAKEFLEQFAEYYSSDERSMPEIIDSFLEQFDDPKVETEELPKSNIKKTLPYDRARLEYMRMQIGPVQQFFMTLGNVVFSMSERIGSLEQQIYILSLKDMMKDEYNCLCAAQGRVVSMDEFKEHWEKMEKQNESKKS